MDINSKALASLGLLGNIYTPDNLKKAYIKDWQKNPTSINYCLEEINKRKATGYAVVTGNDGLIALDFDGNNANRIAVEALPWVMDIATLTWSSGKPNRKGKMFRIPEDRRQEFAHITKRSIRSYINIKELPSESLEVSYKRSKVTLPPSAHPETDGYEWVNFIPIHELDNSQCDSLLELLRKNYEKHEPIKQYTFTDTIQRGKAIALEALDYINPDLAYEDWIKVGTALKNIGFTLSVWDSWSSKGEKYTRTNPRQIEQKWQSFTDKRQGIQTLLYYADGYDQTKSKHYTLTDRKITKNKPRLVNKQIRNSQKPEAKKQSNIEKYPTFLYSDALINGLGEKREYLLGGLIPKGEMILLTAQPKTGKTLLAYDLAYAVLTGGELLGERCQQGKVWFISSDESKYTTLERLSDRGFDRLDNTNDLMITLGFDVSDMDELKKKVDSFKPDLVIFDSLSSITRNVLFSENSKEFGNLVYNVKTFLAEKQIASLLIHHNNKSKDAKGIDKVAGTGRISAAAYAIWMMFGSEGNYRTLSITSREDAHTKHSLRLNDIDDWIEKSIFTHTSNDNFGQKGAGQKERILTLLERNPDGLESAEIANILGINSESTRRTITRLKKENKIEKRPSKTNSKRNVYYLNNDKLQEKRDDTNTNGSQKVVPVVVPVAKPYPNKDLGAKWDKTSHRDILVPPTCPTSTGTKRDCPPPSVPVNSKSIDNKEIDNWDNNWDKKTELSQLKENKNTNNSEQKELFSIVNSNNIAKELSVLFSKNKLITRDERLAYVENFFNDNSIENINSLSDKQIFSLLEHLKIEE